ncbi:MAG: HAMP domain-containing sensor histidine kinase [Cyanobacteria bacterium P01_D01_bin.105]
MHVSALQKSLPDPVRMAGDFFSLGINATLSDLPLYLFSVTAGGVIKGLIGHFIANHDLPGVVIEERNHVSVLSRQQFLECLLQLGHTTWFQDGPVQLLLDRTSRKALILPGDTPILLGAQQALRRSSDAQNEPILVKKGDQHYLLDSDILNVAHWHIRGIETQIRYERLQMQLLQSEKMAALGRLVDGVAHEILDPVSFIWGNLSYINEYANQQNALIAAYEAALPNPPAEIVELKEQIEFDYLKEDFPAAIKSARSGAHRLRQLATSLQNFCHIDEVHPRPTDINALLDSTLRLLKNKLTSSVNIECSYGKLPPVPCFPGQLSQVFMNILTNAIDSLLAETLREEKTPNDNVASPEITVTTTVCSAQAELKKTPNVARWISIIISDNGPGLPPETKAQILESFSAKSRLRKETGLAMSYRIVTAKHGGRLWMRSLHESEMEDMIADGASCPVTGTEFEIMLPLTTCEER